MSGELLVQAALIGPAAAGLVWLGLSGLPWPWVRRVAGGLLALAAHVAAWWVLVREFRGGSVAWRTMEPGLLGASLAVAGTLAVLIVVPRAEALPRGQSVAAVVGLAVAATGLVGTSYARSLTLQAVLVPLPTIAAGLAALATGRAGARGLLGLALADGAAVAGLCVLLDRSGTTAVTPAAMGLGAGLLLGAAAAKAGAIPFFGTWRLSATEGPGGLVSTALRAQGIALAALVAFGITGVSESVPLAWAAAGAALLAGASGILVRGEAGSVAAVTGAGAALPFLALGLGGAVGARAFLALFPAFLLAAAGLQALAWPGPERWRPVLLARWVGVLATGVLVLSLLGLPPGGGFPGAWLALSLAQERVGSSLWYLAIAGTAALGLAAAAVASVPLARAARPRGLAAAIAGPLALFLVYLGTQPVRLGLGWLLRIEREAGLPEVLPASGAPALPAASGVDLLLAALPALVVAIALVALARGVREEGAAFTPLLGEPGAPGRLRRAAEPLLRRARRWSLGLAVAGMVEAAALAGVAWVVLKSVDLGFL
ncbi:MAG TPA: hypothetical protein VGB51_05215 [Actinomycetota bacterium]